jgi:chromosome segregation ATPase
LKLAELGQSSDIITANHWKERQKLEAQLEEAKADIESQAFLIGSSREEIEKLRSQLETERADHQQVEAQLSSLRSQLAAVQADQEELAQLKKEAKEAAAEIHREGRSIELEKVRWQRELSDARAELEDTKATMLSQGDKIRELERGYSLKPNPAESRLRLEIGDLRSQLAEQNPAPAIDLSDKAGEVVSYLKTLLCDEKLLNSTLTKIKRNKPVLLPREVISKVEGILSGGDKKTPTDARELLNEG